MSGLLSYGAYIPRTRMALSLPGGAAPAKGAGASGTAVTGASAAAVGASAGDAGAVARAPERAVAWADEDSVTMAVAAGASCLRGFERARVDALFFASTTPPFAEKQAAALVASALALPATLRCADFGGSLRAGSDALSAALDAVTAGSAARVLVLASDCRPAAPGSALERNFGDGAAAFLVGAGDDDLIATHEGAHFVAEEIVDLWRAPGDAFVHTWEERFVVQQGFSPAVQQAVRGLLTKLGADAAAFAKFALAAPDARTHAATARALGFARAACVPPHFGELGHAGAAFAPLLLTGALESAQPGERVLLANYGDGCAAHAFKMCAPRARAAKLETRRALAWHLARRTPVARYEHFLRARNLLPREFPEARGPGLSATAHLRERADELSFLAQRCGACSALQFPAQRVCERCFAKDNFTREPLSSKRGAVVTYTLDYFFPSPTPPTIVCVVDVEGARVHLQLADAEPDAVRTGLPVEFVFRRIHTAGGRPNYYWKARPVADAPGEPT